MHLATNSIGHLLEAMAGSYVFVLTAFYGEVLSCYFWHLGIVGLSALLLIRQWQNRSTGERTPLGFLLLELSLLLQQRLRVSS